MIEGDKLDDNAKVEASEVLALIIRQQGKTVQQAISSQIQTTLMTILQAKEYNDKTVTNCAAALAFLAAYSAEPEKQMA